MELNARLEKGKEETKECSSPLNKGRAERRSIYRTKE
jgi:hypothetical protein